MTATTKPCPARPDGYIWNANGQTARACPTCGGYAALNLDGSRIDGKRVESDEYEPSERAREFDQAAGK